VNEETGSERELLEAHLDQNRATAVRKLRGLPWDLAVRRLGPTPTSAAGIVKHLIDVERWWFRHQLAGEGWVSPWSTRDNPDGEFDLGDDESVESLITEYERACAESRAIAGGLALTDRCVAASRHGTRPSLRWVYLHMIEELARHNGHLDIYRELLDGQTDRDEP
jgi:hypothetical protein